ncbi:MAG: hypothetical protein JWM82_4274 [Myxococcales bacterium]|nr:hypothetical protein [Myxococcales bacterium]
MTPSDADAEPTRALATSPVTFEGLACAGATVLRSPVSGQPCVYWRVRIAQRLTARTQLVHEMESEEPFEVTWQRPEASVGGPPALRLRLDPTVSRIEAPPVLHREGTPGAEAAAQYFGLAGAVSVEETLIRLRESLTADGIIRDLDAAVGAGPTRGTSRGPELVDALVTVESKSLGPVLLPWALSTAAALMGGMGLATYAAWRGHLIQMPPTSSLRLPRLFRGGQGIDQMQPPEMPHPRLP